MRKTRAVLLPTTGWPFLVRLWLENFKSWEDKVDKVYLVIPESTKPEFLAYLKAQITKMQFIDKVVIVETNASWTDSYTEAYKASKEDLFVIMHDDTYINNPEMIDEYFDMAEAGVVVTPMWDSLGPKEEAEAWLKEKYPGVFPIGPYGDAYMFVLVLIFISRINLEKTRIDFNGFKNEQGIGFDAGGKLMLDLLDNGVKIHPLPRYHSQSVERGDYFHYSGMASSVPQMLESGELPGPSWDPPNLKKKLDHIEKALQLDDFIEVSEYRDLIIKRIKEFREEMEKL